MQALEVNNQAEVLGKSDFDIFEPNIAEKFYRDEQNIINTGQPLINKEELLPNPVSGNHHWVLTTKVPLRKENNEIQGIVGTGHDITERKLFEEELKQAKKNSRGIEPFQE